jgi:hypothetical protein
MSGVVPAKIAASFTMAELAVLTVVARQCQRSGTCSLHIDAISALAGCCRTVVKNALRQARLLGLLLVKERRIPGRKSLTNVTSIVSREWLGWLKLGVGVKRMTTTDNHFHSKSESARIVPRGGSYRPYIRLGGSRAGLFG